MYLPKIDSAYVTFSSCQVCLLCTMILQYVVPSTSEMKQTVLQKFGITPCDWQIKSARAQLQRNDVITVSPTGSGKTMTFWTPMLFNGNGIMIVITLLNILGEKNEVEGNLFGIPAVSLTAKTATDEDFEVLSVIRPTGEYSPHCDRQLNNSNTRSLLLALSASSKISAFDACSGQQSLQTDSLTSLWTRHIVSVSGGINSEVTMVN